MGKLDRPLYLRPNVAAEPLVDRWYAWTHLIPPAPAARNLAERHLPIMESYISDPDAHAAAAHHPALAGGPFVNYDRDRVAEIAALRDRTRADRHHLIELSAAITELDSLLAERARGYSLEPLYESIPAPLEGYVELAYDLGNRPSFRLLEPLLYKSRYYDRSAQSLMLAAVSDDSRPFIFSTPRLDDDRSFHWQTPFDSQAIDTFFRLKYQPARYSAILDLFNLSPSDESILSSFLTEREPPRRARYEGPGLRWRYFGHACVLLETRDCTILTDPVVAYSYDNVSPRLTYGDLPEHIDFVLLTHAHQDHVVLETLLQIRDRIGTILVPGNSGGYLQDPSLRLALQACGFRNVLDLAEMEELRVDSGTVQAIPFTGEHCDLDIRSKTGWLVRLAGHSMLFGADSRNVNPGMYRRVHEQTGDIDTLFIGMECDGAPLSWIYGPLLARRPERAIDQSRRANGSDYAAAMRMVEQFNCRAVYVYAMGQEPWLHYISSIQYDDDSNPIVESNRLVEAARRKGIAAERLFGLKEQVLP
jgi:L-ascorbate metabolism protein UlaG (beta-lactamase superfamily)